MTPNELDQFDDGAVRALLVAAIDDLLRLCASVAHGAHDGAEADAESLLHTWAWSTGPNVYSDGTVIAASTTDTHIYAPPGRREDHR